jgi:uncharacterized lipoprotein YehR (DUF1307 family)
MGKLLPASRFGSAVLLLIIFAVVLTGCGDKEPEQRKAFAALIQDKILDKQGIAL